MVIEEKEPENDVKKLINPPGTEGVYEKMKFFQAVRATAVADNVDHYNFQV